jgi:succinoglycan biosynthesis protein ExoM
MRVAICVATCRRPMSLARLLRSLGALRFRKQSADPVIVVVDNDERATAREVVERARGEIPWPVLYDVEPTRNIPLARNRAIELALQQDPDFVAFIDDDEAALPNWLDELIDVQVRHGADVVGGVVLPRYEEGVPQWVVRGGFFENPRYRTGSPVAMAFTGNALISRRLLEDPTGRFDPAFGIAGSEDSHFFMRVHHTGKTMVWADEAVVEEVVPASRATASWILRRAFRVGNGYVFCERAILPRHRWVVPRVAKAVFRITEGVLLVGPSTLGGRAPAVRALRKVAHGMGCLVGLAGIRYREYEVIHGK